MALAVPVEAGKLSLEGRAKTFEHTFKQGETSEAFVQSGVPERILVGGHFDITFDAKEGDDFEFIAQD